MHYKTKSYLTIAVLLAFMFSIAFVINNAQNQVTGAVVAPICECNENSDCNDNNPATEDICLYPDDCQASLCVYN